AKVDGKLVPLSYQLHSGEVVEIITQKKKKPSKSWLKFVKTSLAKRRIKNLLLKEKI
ncbi:bifunctional (p)ppGpp synthetase/guanosine-3',5'-bis(diphosphate) 3'-pyrophosphohydrolase, partial [bacterium]|nr:bifunctional (p)ppGpp synthetase/guanosine-3',5'-bis(diphosphate) 3'-pyrophosphohydrolase [bacterium]